MDTQKPEEQYGCRASRRLEEHLLTASLTIEKTLAWNVPLWIVSLDLSKAFDRVHWPTLWQALRQQGVSDHLIWVMQLLYENQEGQVLGDWSRSRPFPISAGVRQGCVLSPHLFTAVLECAMRSWRFHLTGFGIDLTDGQKSLIDLRFAGDVLLFAKSSEEATELLDELISHRPCIQCCQDSCADD